MRKMLSGCSFTMCTLLMKGRPPIVTASSTTWFQCSCVTSPKRILRHFERERYAIFTGRTTRVPRKIEVVDLASDTIIWFILLKNKRTVMQILLIKVRHQCSKRTPRTYKLKKCLSQKCKGKQKLNCNIIFQWPFWKEDRKINYNKLF